MAFRQALVTRSGSCIKLAGNPLDEAGDGDLVYCCLHCLALAKGSLGALERLVQSVQSDAKPSSEPSQIETYAAPRLGSLDVWDASERLCRCRVLILSLCLLPGWPLVTVLH